MKKMINLKINDIPVPLFRRAQASCRRPNRQKSRFLLFATSRISTASAYLPCLRRRDQGPQGSDCRMYLPR